MPCVSPAPPAGWLVERDAVEELDSERGRKAPNSPSKKKESGTLSRSLRLRACGGAVGLHIGKEFLEAHAGSFPELVAHGSLGNGRLLFVRVVGTSALDVSSLDHIILQVLHLLLQNALFEFLEALCFICDVHPVAEIAVVDFAFLAVQSCGEFVRPISGMVVLLLIG